MKHELQCRNNAFGLVREEPHRRTASRAEGVVRHAGNKVVGGTTVHRLPTYNCLRAGRFTNVLLAMMVMILLYKCLQMKAD